MTRKFFLASLLVVAVSLSAKQYPDSVMQASQEEPNIATGWNFEFGGGFGVSGYRFSQLGSSFSPTYTTNKLGFPAGNAAVGINYYFVPWMGIGTGVEFSAYSNRTAVTKPWSETTYDQYGTDPWCRYTITSTPNKLSELQNLYMVEVPVALKFRYRPGVVGMTAAVGMKLGFPVYNNYSLAAGGSFANKVYYDYFDLLMEDVPNVVEDINIPGAGGQLQSSRFKKLNYGVYMELGMLIRLHQRVELGISAFGTYYVNDVLATHGTAPLGFADGTKAGVYPMPYTSPYNGVLRSNEVESLHPWSAGLKLTIQVNASRQKAKREYDKEQRRLRKQQKEEEKAKQDTIVPADVIIVDSTPTEITDSVLELENSLDPRDEAIRRIVEIADSNGIKLCDLFCVLQDTVYVHDTVYLYRDPEPTPVIKEDPVAKQLDDLLAKAVIFFDLDKAIPILEPEDILIRIAEIMKRHPEQKIHVNGHACKLGKPDYNQRLALRRAKAVAAQLKELGVRDDQMIIASLGDDIPYRYQGQHQLSKDRRVEIVPTYRTTEIVRPGSRLAQIARRHYGNPDYWVFIYEANRDQIVDPSDLPVGIEVEIPNLSERLKGMNETQAAAEAQRLKEEILKK